MNNRLMIYDKSYIETVSILKTKRKEMYTQKEFAKLLGVTQKTISYYENCQSELNLKLFIKMCHLLQIDFFSDFSKIFLNEYSNSNI
ncbi:MULTISPECIES: helix-turn-helix transcriptional regulator [Fusobacterium]|uniref:helix-turn-helix transcriptional regulator n=1 Tax=Fusobacterium TaxID=848 RepID=UPI0014773F67|nr:MULTISPECIES: helix-turn-helix transcriptional regulator [Fusobacterium]NME35819.1 helix-turn-helix transcriptional regulator [Fusobacterium sp. FSA-380-WT-3A]